MYIKQLISRRGTAAGVFCGLCVWLGEQRFTLNQRSASTNNSAVKRSLVRYFNYALTEAQEEAGFHCRSPEVMSLLLTVTAVVAACAILAHYVRRLKHLSRWDHFPGYKSYSSIPLAGHVWRISNFLQHFRQMQADHGDVFRLDWGDRPTVYVCSHELASEALSSDAFNGMPHKDMMGLNQIFKVDEAGYQSGSFSVGQSWMRTRNFLIAQLDDFEQGAMPVGSMEGVVREESVSLCDLMSSAVREAGGKPLTLHRLLRPVANNVLWRFTSGRRTHYTDPEVQLLNKSLDNYFKIMDPTSVTSYLPWLHYLILYLRMEHAWFGRLCKTLRLGSEITDFSKDMEALFRAEVASGMQDPSGSYVDRFMAVSARTPFKISPFHPRNAGTQLMGSLFALFLTGPFLVTSFLEWTVLYLIAFPEVQKKAREEIIKGWKTAWQIGKVWHRGYKAFLSV